MIEEAREGECREGNGEYDGQNEKEALYSAALLVVTTASSATAQEASGFAVSLLEQNKDDECDGNNNLDNGNSALHERILVTIRF